MTVQDIEAGRFSFAAFLCAPNAASVTGPLLVMLAVVLAARRSLLMPGDYEVTGRSALYAAGSVSNFYFFWHTGYFNSPSEMMPLLHTWSLRSEEKVQPRVACLTRPYRPRRWHEPPQGRKRWSQSSA